MIATERASQTCDEGSLHRVMGEEGGDVPAHVSEPQTTGVKFILWSFAADYHETDGSVTTSDWQTQGCMIERCIMTLSNA